MILALSRDVPVGYAYLEIVRRPETGQRHTYEAVFLHHIVVAPEARRKGVGTALLDEVREVGRALGINRLALDTWSFNEPAKTFFRRYGFVTCSERMWMD